jgi:YVTN family beta-propeller protein
VRLFAALLILVCAVSVSSGQYVETTVPLPDSLPTLVDIRALVYHSTNSTIYVCGSWDSTILAVDARTNKKLAGICTGEGSHRVLCSAPPENKVYCANYDATVTVIDGATNQVVRTFALEQQVSDFVYNEHEGKLYCGNVMDTLVRVIDCSGDSIVARVDVEGRRDTSLIYCSSTIASNAHQLGTCC